MIEIELYDTNLKDKILELPYTNKIDDNGILIPESDYGFAEIYRFHNDILVFLIPQYGGTLSFYRSWGRHAIDHLIEELKK